MGGEPSMPWSEVGTPFFRGRVLQNAADQRREKMKQGPWGDNYILAILLTVSFPKWTFTHVFLSSSLQCQDDPYITFKSCLGHHLMSPVLPRLGQVPLLCAYSALNSLYWNFCLLPTFPMRWKLLEGRHRGYSSFIPLNPWFFWHVRDAQ